MTNFRKLGKSFNVKRRLSPLQERDDNFYFKKIHVIRAAKF